MPTRSRRRATTTTVLAVALALAACGAEDDGAAVTEIGEGEGSVSGSASGSGSASASGSAPASGSGSASSSTPSSEGGVTAPDGGYAYVSDVSAHRLVVDDVCLVKDALDADEIDFDAIATVYRDGVSSVNADGSVRSLGGFASRDDRAHGLDAYHGTATPLDDVVTAALEGSGAFAGEADAVRAQAVEKGVQNRVMVAWVVHELNTALAKAEDGDLDPLEGAPHNWDEAWAFYHGASPGCAPYATADSRAANFGTTGEGDTALANEAILAAMEAGRDALLDADVDGARAAADEVVRNVVITYSQAAVRYATLAVDDVAAGDLATAREHQAEGGAFWRVIAAVVAPAGADVDAVDAIFDLAADPGARGGGDEVRAALEPAWDALGITNDDIGALS